MDGADLDARRIAALTRWFETHARDLPWRRKRSGYAALVSEAMLQQTQVSRVAERFPAFMRRFPTVAALAAADLQDVLELWQGMGYYRRARNLHAAARMVVDEFGGRVPRDAKTLETLPGVGRYTAGAIASIAYGAAAPIVDGNVRRVLARWAGAEADDLEAWAWERAEELVQAAAQPGVFNEALMELGATVCSPRAPRCLVCPIADDCVANAKGIQDRIPAPKTAPARRELHHHAVLLTRGDRLLVEQRAAGGLWSELWQPPTVEAERELKPAVLIETFAGAALRLESLNHRGTFEHATTHRRIHFHVYAAKTRRRKGTWQVLAEIETLPMSAAHRRVLEFLEGRPEAGCPCHYRSERSGGR